MTYIGIDPDRERNGVAVYDTSGKKLEYLDNLTFFELFDYLKKLQASCESLCVVVEAGWMNNGNWHTKASDSARKAAKIGKWVGGNHEVGRKIVEMCEYLNIPYRTVIPTRHKVDADYFAKLTGWKGRTNQEQRDAGMLVFGICSEETLCGIPIKKM